MAAVASRKKLGSGLVRLNEGKGRGQDGEKGGTRRENGRDGQAAWAWVRGVPERGRVEALAVAKREEARAARLN